METGCRIYCVSELVLLTVLCCGLFASRSAAEDRDQRAIEVLKKAAAAKGRAGNLEKAMTFHCSGSFFMFGPKMEVLPGQVEKWVTPGMIRIKSLIQLSDRNVQIDGGRNSGGRGWQSQDGLEPDVSAEVTRFFSLLSQVQDWSALVRILDNNQFDLKFLGKSKRRKYRSVIKINQVDKTCLVVGLNYDVELVGIEIASKGNSAIGCSLYFDKDDYTLVSVVYKLASNNTGPPTEREHQFTNYRRVNGVRVPFTETLIEDGRVDNKAEYNEITFHEKFDAAVFDSKKSNKK